MCYALLFIPDELKRYLKEVNPKFIFTEKQLMPNILESTAALQLKVGLRLC